MGSVLKVVLFLFSGVAVVGGLVLSFICWLTYRIRGYDYSQDDGT
jgi:hypothetical protein